MIITRATPSHLQRLQMLTPPLSFRLGFASLTLSFRVPPFSIHSRLPIPGSRFGLAPPLSVMNKLTTPLDVELPNVT